MRTLLQKIAEALEDRGVSVSCVETWPPEENGDISVSLRVREKTANELEAFTGQEMAARRFFREHTAFSDSAFERLKTAYEAYCFYLKHYTGEFIETEPMPKHKFVHFAMKYYPEYRIRAIKIKEKNEACFLDFRLSDSFPTENSICAEEGPCNCCADNRETCPSNLKDNIPVKLYTPEEAVKAMLDGKILKNKDGLEHRWFSDEDPKKTGFWYQDKNDEFCLVKDFSCLYKELTFPQFDKPEKTK